MINISPPTPFVRKAGDVMTGDLDLGLNLLKLTDGEFGGILRGSGSVADLITVRNAANGDYGDIYMRGLHTFGDITLASAKSVDGVGVSELPALIALKYDKTGGKLSGDITFAGAQTVDGKDVSELEFGSYTLEDDESQAMLKAHAYLANQDGIVTARMTASIAGDDLKGFIGTTTDPAGAGDQIKGDHAYGAGEDVSISFPVAAGKYFEITDNSSNPTVIRWHPNVKTLVKPTDNN